MSMQHVHYERFHKKLMEDHRDGMARKEIDFLNAKHDYVRSKRKTKENVEGDLSLLDM